MKLRSLFLASLAALAMVSCSNEDQIIGGDNGVKAGNALVQFAISAPQTRTTTPEDGGAIVGSDEENGFSNIVIVLKYANSQKVFDLATDKFKKEGQMLYMITPQVVPAGTATAYVFVNGTENDENADYTQLTHEIAYSNSYDILTIAEDNKFLMTNSDKVTQLSFTEGQTTTATINVDRVVAKIEEKSSTDAIDVTIGATDVDGNTVDYQGKSLSIKLTEYAYTDLNQKCNLLTPGTTSTTFFQPLAGKGPYIYKTVGTQNTYCLENPNAVSIVYKGKAYWDGIEATESFYTADGKLYMNYGELLTAYKVLPFDKDGTIEEFYSIGINKFEDGYCYYVGQIQNADGTATIVRNNIYRLSVSTISNLGTTIPGGQDDKFAFLKMNVEINKWTVNLNSFAF